MSKVQSKEVKDAKKPSASKSVPSLEDHVFDEDKILLETFLANPENKKSAGEVAFQIKSDFPNWFKIPQIVKKFKISTDQAAKQIEMLMLFKFCVGKVEKGVPLFKIDLDHKVQRTLLLEQIAEKEGEILFLKEKLHTLD